MGWIIAISVISFIFIYLLFASLFIEINSTAGLYRIRFYGLASGRLYLADSSLIADLKIALWHKKIDLFALKKKEKKKEKKTKKRKIKFRKILGVIKSFKINTFRLLIDSGNARTNGILFPFFYLLSRLSGKTFEINFTDENEISLEIENNIARMLWAYFNS
jgi:hypothetical protein